MRNHIIRGTFVLTLPLPPAVPPLSGPRAPNATEAQAVKPDLDKVNQHLTRHQTTRRRGRSSSRRAKGWSTSRPARSAGSPTTWPTEPTSRRPR